MYLTEQPKKRAVAYYRHSAEDKQENSVEIQREHVHRFAEEQGIEIIHEEADEGESGLSADRPGFDRLFKNFILNPSAPLFEYVLVLDVSRWGRWQDQDEAAWWEIRCKKRGKQVIFVSKGFPKVEHQLIFHLQTSIERYMAAEYSRVLSEKVADGSKKVSQQGFSAGGAAAYGMVRVLLDESKNPIGILKTGEHKVISNQRVTFAPANDKTTETVKTIFSLFVQENLSLQKIADTLNAQGIKSPKGGAWNSQKIIRILENETYIGTRIYNKSWKRLKQKQRQNPRSDWVICKNAFEAIVDKETFKSAQEKLDLILRARSKQGSIVINKIVKQFKDELREFLQSHFKINEEKLWYALKHSPFVFSAAYSRQAKMCWCFTISERMRQNPFVIAAAIEASSQTISNFFLIPTIKFGLGKFLVLTEKDPNSRKYLIERDLLKKKILDVVSSSLKCPTLHGYYQGHETVSSPNNS